MHSSKVRVAWHAYQRSSSFTRSRLSQLSRVPPYHDAIATYSTGAADDPANKLPPDGFNKQRPPSHNEREGYSSRSWQYSKTDKRFVLRSASAQRTNPSKARAITVDDMKEAIIIQTREDTPYPVGSEEDLSSVFEYREGTARAVEHVEDPRNAAFEWGVCARREDTTNSLARKVERILKDEDFKTLTQESSTPATTYSLPTISWSGGYRKDTTSSLVKVEGNILKVGPETQLLQSLPSTPHLEDTRLLERKVKDRLKVESFIEPEQKASPTTMYSLPYIRVHCEDTTSSLAKVEGNNLNKMGSKTQLLQSSLPNLPPEDKIHPLTREVKDNLKDGEIKKPKQKSSPRALVPAPPFGSWGMGNDREDTNSPRDLKYNLKEAGSEALSVQPSPPVPDGDWGLHDAVEKRNDATSSKIPVKHDVQSSSRPSLTKPAKSAMQASTKAPKKTELRALPTTLDGTLSMPLALKPELLALPSLDYVISPRNKVKKRLSRSQRKAAKKRATQILAPPDGVPFLIDSQDEITLDAEPSKPSGWKDEKDKYIDHLIKIGELDPTLKEGDTEYQVYMKTTMRARAKLAIITKKLPKLPEPIDNAHWEHFVFCSANYVAEKKKMAQLPDEPNWNDLYGDWWSPELHRSINVRLEKIGDNIINLCNGRALDKNGEKIFNFFGQHDKVFQYQIKDRFLHLEGMKMMLENRDGLSYFANHYGFGQRIRLQRLYSSTVVKSHDGKPVLFAYLRSTLESVFESYIGALVVSRALKEKFPGRDFRREDLWHEMLNMTISVGAPEIEDWYVDFLEHPIELCAEFMAVWTRTADSRLLITAGDLWYGTCQNLKQTAEHLFGVTNDQLRVKNKKLQDENKRLRAANEILSNKNATLMEIKKMIERLRHSNLDEVVRKENPESKTEIKTEDFPPEKASPNSNSVFKIVESEQTGIDAQIKIPVDTSAIASQPNAEPRKIVRIVRLNRWQHADEDPAHFADQERLNLIAPGPYKEGHERLHGMQTNDQQESTVGNPRHDFMATPSLLFNIDAIHHRWGAPGRQVSGLDQCLQRDLRVLYDGGLFGKVPQHIHNLWYHNDVYAPRPHAVRGKFEYIDSIALDDSIKPARADYHHPHKFKEHAHEPQRHRYYYPKLISAHP